MIFGVKEKDSFGLAVASEPTSLLGSRHCGIDRSALRIISTGLVGVYFVTG